MERPIGTCSKCGGPVALPSMMVNPVPRCRDCGATMKRPYGPIMPMEGGKIDEELKKLPLV